MIILIRKKILETIKTSLLPMCQCLCQYEQLSQLPIMIPENYHQCIIFTNQPIAISHLPTLHPQVVLVSISIQLIQQGEGWHQIIGSTTVSYSQDKQSHYERWYPLILTQILIEKGWIVFRVLFKLLNEKISLLINEMMEDLSINENKQLIANTFNEFTEYPNVTEVVYESFYSPSELKALLLKDTYPSIFIIILDEVDLQSYLSLVVPSHHRVNKYVRPKRHNYTATKQKYNTIKWID